MLHIYQIYKYWTEIELRRLLYTQIPIYSNIIFHLVSLYEKKIIKKGTPHIMAYGIKRNRVQFSMAVRHTEGLLKDEIFWKRTRILILQVKHFCR